MEVLTGYIMEVRPGPEHTASLLIRPHGEAFRILPIKPQGAVVELQESSTPDVRFLSAQSMVESLARANQGEKIVIFLEVHGNFLNSLSG
jgi:hypothetical protein